MLSEVKCKKKLKHGKLAQETCLTDSTSNTGQDLSIFKMVLL